MNAPRTAASTRLAGVVFALFASVAVLGGTAGAMQAAADRDASSVQTLAQVTISAAKSN